MAAGMLITIREGLEAFLITGILLAYLRKVGHGALARYVWAGTAALSFIAFITVLREGLETAVLLSALASRASGQGVLPGAALSLVAAVVICYAYFALSVRFNLRTFFVVTGVLLIFIAAGLCAHVFMALHELGVHVGPERVWSTKWLLDSDGFAGRILHAFVGYHDEPSLLQVLAYFGYLAGMGFAFARAVRGSARSRPEERAPVQARTA